MQQTRCAEPLSSHQVQVVPVREALNQMAPARRRMTRRLPVLRRFGSSSPRLQLKLLQLRAQGRVTRIKVSGSLVAASVLVITMSHVLLFTPRQDASEDWLQMIAVPLALLAPMLMLLALRPSDRIGTLVAAAVLALSCLYQMIILPLFVAMNRTSDRLVIANAAVLTCFESVWGVLYFVHGPYEAVLSMWFDDDKYATHPRAALNGMWWVCRIGSGCFACIQLTFAACAAFLSATDAQPEPEAE
eukprot:5338084-Prymnesium_polylepis.1